MSEISEGGRDYPSTRSFSSQISEEESPRISLDLVAAARRNLKFLRYVADSDWLHHPSTLLLAIRRYEELWMPLISNLTDRHPPMILPPVDIEWVWYCHTLNPVRYRDYCETKFSRVIGKPTIFDEENEEYAVNRCREVWLKSYPNEAFENELEFMEFGGADRMNGEDIIDELQGWLSEMRKQRELCKRFFMEPYMGEIVYLIAAKRRYKKMLQLLLQQMEGDGVCGVFVPTLDILLMWLTHQSYPTVYAADTKHMGDEVQLKVVGPWDQSVKEQDREETKKLWVANFDQPYEKAGGMALVAADLGGGLPSQTLFYWVVSDSDVNNMYKSLHPRYLLGPVWFKKNWNQ